MAALAVSDALLCVYYSQGSASGWDRGLVAMLLFLAPNYLAYAALILLGKWITGRARFVVLLGGGILGALVFYFVTNTGAWLQNPEYPKTLAGWVQALTVGTPGWPHTWEFFRNTLLSGGLFTGLFAGAMKLAGAAEPEEEEEAEPAGEVEAGAGETGAEPVQIAAIASPRQAIEPRPGAPGRPLERLDLPLLSVDFEIHYSAWQFCRIDSIKPLFRSPKTPLGGPPRARAGRREKPAATLAGPDLAIQLSPDR